MENFVDEAQKKHDEMVEERKAEYQPIDDICISQNLPINAREWEYQTEGEVNQCLAAIVTRYTHQAIKRGKKQFYSGNVLRRMFEILLSTLNKLISGKKYMGGAELEKYREEMKRKGMDIPKRHEVRGS